MKKRFKKINIEISNICNLQCSFCPEVLREKRLMSLELFESIIQQAGPLTKQVCLHLMGEPLLHPKLEQFINVCEQQQVKIFLVTNGVLLKDKHSEILLNKSIEQVNFSLHSFNDNFPDKDPTEYLAKIFKFTETATANRPDLYINFRIWNLKDPRSNQHSHIKILSMIQQYYGFQIKQALDLRLQKSLKIFNRVYLHFDTEFVWPSLDQPFLGTQGTCKALTDHIGILADGTVVPCCLDKEGVMPLGKLPAENLNQILSSEKAQKILNGFRHRKLTEKLCQHCNYIDRFGRTNQSDPKALSPAESTSINI